MNTTFEGPPKPPGERPDLDRMSNIACWAWLAAGTGALLLLGSHPRLLAVSCALAVAVWLRHFKWFSWERWLGGMFALGLLYLVWIEPADFLRDLAMPILIMAAFVGVFIMGIAAWESWPRTRPWIIGAMVVWVLASLGHGLYSYVSRGPTGLAPDDYIDPYEHLDDQEQYYP